MDNRNTKELPDLKRDSLVSSLIATPNFYEIKKWEFDTTHDDGLNIGYNDCLCIMFIQTGRFSFDLAKQFHHLHTGHVLIDKPDYEYRLRPSTGECSIINFTNDFYKQLLDDLNLKFSFFFSNAHILTLMLITTPEMEYLHYQLARKKVVGKLEMDSVVIELVKLIVSTITQLPGDDELNATLKEFHLAPMEKAKEYINENFYRDISLFELASFACVSPFHFSRIFKRFTSFSPRQYLQNVRLKHSEMLLKTSMMPIADVSFNSGYTTAEYFATAFRQKYGMTPTDFRKALFA